MLWATPLAQIWIWVAWVPEMNPAIGSNLLAGNAAGAGAGAVAEGGGDDAGGAVGADDEVAAWVTRALTIMRLI